MFFDKKVDEVGLEATNMSDAKLDGAEEQLSGKKE